MKFEDFQRLFFYVQNNPGQEKWTFSSLQPGIHYTIRYWSGKKTIDFHRKDENTGEYYTYFEISTFKFLLLMRRFTKVNEYLIKEFWLGRKINPGKLRRKQCWLIALDSKNSTYPELHKIYGGGRRMKIKKDFSFNAAIDALEFIDAKELQNCNEGSFLVCSYKSGNLVCQGWVVKYAMLKGNYFITKKDFNLYSKLLLVVMHNLISMTSFDNSEEVRKEIRNILTKKYSTVHRQLLAD